MCIAIYNPYTGNELDKELLANCHQSNPDGMGIMWTEDGVLKCYKTVDEFDTFCNVYNYARSQGTTVLHFRKATHGKVSKKNCHPFFVSKDMAFVHNGVIRSHADNRDTSDTKSFMMDILRHLPEGWLDTGGLNKLVYDYIRGNKMVFMLSDGKVWIFHKSDGIDRKGNWFSNSSYMSFKPTKTKTYVSKDGTQYSDAYYPWKSEIGFIVDDVVYCEKCVPIDKVKTAEFCTKENMGYTGYTRCKNCNDSIFVSTGKSLVRKNGRS